MQNTLLYFYLQGPEYQRFLIIFGGLLILALIYFISLKLLHRATNIIEEEHAKIIASLEKEKRKIQLYSDSKL